jgi:hypothetical protein
MGRWSRLGRPRARHPYALTKPRKQVGLGFLLVVIEAQPGARRLKPLRGPLDEFEVRVARCGVESDQRAQIIDCFLRWCIHRAMSQIDAPKSRIISFKFEIMF